MTNTLTCPHCGKPVEMTQAIRLQVESEVLAEAHKKHEEELVKVKQTIEEQIKKEFTQKSEVELSDLKKQLAQKDEKVKQLQEFELRLREENRKLDEKRKDLELETARKLDEERKKIETTVETRFVEEHRLKEKEKDKVIDDLKKALEDAQRKATQGSQQLQGEVAELDLEDLFRRSFPQDSIEPIAKGALGADIRQVVKSPLGTVCGAILWESKRTKAWSDGWVTKLKGDMIADKAHACAIISEVLPEEAKSGIGVRNGVWVTSPQLVISLATLLRERFLAVAKQKKVDENKQTKAEELYTFITSIEFQQQVQSMTETYTEMLGQIQKERNALERSWKLREQQVQKLLSGVSGIYGSMQGIAGSNLPTVKGLDLLEEGQE